MVWFWTFNDSNKNPGIDNVGHEVVDMLLEVVVVAIPLDLLNRCKWVLHVMVTVRPKVFVVTEQVLHIQRKLIKLQCQLYICKSDNSLTIRWRLYVHRLTTSR